MFSKNLRLTFPVTLGIALVFSITSARAAQNDWTFDIGAGPSPTTGEISSRLTTGWIVDLRAGPDFNSEWSLIGEFTYNGLGVANRVLRALDVPNGDAHMWSLTVGPMWRIPATANVHPYVLGGIGWYRRTVEFTEPTLGVIAVIDPWWGYVGPALVRVDQVLGSVTRNALGANIGGGVSFALGESGAAVFAEVRYHFANTKPISTAIVPVTFGMRVTGRRTTTSRP
jgi:hypothetical protein